MKQAPLAPIFFVVLIDLIGFGMVLPNLAFFAASAGATPLLIGLLYSSYSVAQLFAAPAWGALSDRIGRRPVMLASTLGSALAYIGLAYSTSLAGFFVCRIAAGLMAGNISAAQAYVADVTDSKNRARGMGVLGAAFGIGFAIGPALGAAVIHADFAGAFLPDRPLASLGLAASALSAASFALVAARLPEPPNEARTAPDSTRVVRVGVFSLSFWKNVRAQDPAMMRLFTAAFLFAFCQSSLYGAFPLFCANQLGLSAAAVGLQYAWMGFLAVFIQGGAMKRLTSRFGEKRLVVSGSLLLGTGLALMPLSQGPWTLAASIGLMSLGGSLCGPPLISLLSKRSDPSRYGATLGTSQGLSALGRAAGPSFGGSLYGLAFVLPFWAAAALAVLTFSITIGLPKSDAN